MSVLNESVVEFLSYFGTYFYLPKYLLYSIPFSSLSQYMILQYNIQMCACSIIKVFL